MFRGEVADKRPDRNDDGLSPRKGFHREKPEAFVIGRDHDTVRRIHRGDEGLPRLCRKALYPLSRISDAAKDQQPAPLLVKLFKCGHESLCVLRPLVPAAEQKEKNVFRHADLFACLLPPGG